MAIKIDDCVISLPIINSTAKLSNQIKYKENQTSTSFDFSKDNQVYVDFFDYPNYKFELNISGVIIYLNEIKNNYKELRDYYIGKMNGLDSVIDFFKKVDDC